MLRFGFLLSVAIPTALAVAPLNLHAQSITVNRIEILEIGMYQARDTGADIEAGSTAAGEVETLANIQLVQQTTTIPMQLGVRFGFRYSLMGSPQGIDVPLKIVTIFPAPGLRNPKGQLFHRDEYLWAQPLGSTLYTDYGFDEPWELAPGIWTFQVWYQDRMLTEHRFTVVRP